MSTINQTADLSHVSDSGRNCLYDLLYSDSNSPGWNWETSQRTCTGTQKRLEDLLSQSGNELCADCGSPDPKWVSLNLGVFICIKCSGVHRSLGVHISKVLSVNLDTWTDEQIDAVISMGGNLKVNKKYEACIPGDLMKPKADSSTKDRKDFIRRKYDLQEFLSSEDQCSCPFPPLHKRPSYSSTKPSSKQSGQDKKKHEKNGSRHLIGHAFRQSRGRKDPDLSTKRSNSLAGMVEFVGLIKVNVVKGTDLAIRDVMTSDPYVILALGNQSVRTRVIKNNLNPIWNESLMLSIPDQIPPLEVFVYDKDKFKTDDFMGDAEINIQPLLNAAKAYETSTTDSILVGNWIANDENALVEDGIISIIDGKVKQTVSLRLQNVERGVLDIELECVPLTQ